MVSQILVIIIASSILTNLQSSFEKDTVGQLAHYTCYVILAMMIVNSFTVSLNLGKKNSRANGKFYADNITSFIDFINSS